MQPFAYQRANNIAEAFKSGPGGRGETGAQMQLPTQYLAGGTTLIDLSKLNVMQPSRLVDINSLQTKYGSISSDSSGLHLGAFVRMSDAADHPDIKRDYPVIAQSLTLAASQQIRNVATLGGNVLQRTRCAYFRDASWAACNKRQPGSGCAAIGGSNRQLAVLGTSKECIANYPGDFAQALIVLDATMDIAGPNGPRVIPFQQLHVLPGNTPHIETTLAPGEIITGYNIAVGPWTRRSLYLKLRDRASYAFALASAAIALDMQGNTVVAARIALGGVASKPWRAREAEAMLQGKALTEDLARQAARAAFAAADTDGEVAFKSKLGQRVMVTALLRAGAMEL